MYNDIINEKSCPEQFLVYLNTERNIDNLVNTFFKSDAYTDYLSMIKELLNLYDPNQQAYKQRDIILASVDRWTK